LLYLITLNDTNTVGRTPLDEGSAGRRDLYVTKHNIHNRQTSMLPAGFETAIPACEQSQTAWPPGSNLRETFSSHVE